MSTAERTTPHQVLVHTTTQQRYDTITPQQRYEVSGGVVGGGGGRVTTHNNYYSEKSPSTSQVLAVITGFPIGVILLSLAGLSLLGTLTGLAVTTPLLILFSPVIVPATIVVGLAVAGFLTSGAFGLTALSSFSWVINYIRETQGTVPEQLEYVKQGVKQGVADVAGYVGQKTKEAGQKTKEVGQDIQSKAEDAKRNSTTTGTTGATTGAAATTTTTRTTTTAAA